MPQRRGDPGQTFLLLMCKASSADASYALPFFCIARISFLLKGLPQKSTSTWAMSCELNGECTQGLRLHAQLRKEENVTHSNSKRKTQKGHSLQAICHTGFVLVLFQIFPDH